MIIILKTFLIIKTLMDDANDINNIHSEINDDGTLPILDHHFNEFKSYLVTPSRTPNFRRLMKVKHNLIDTILLFTYLVNVTNTYHEQEEYGFNGHYVLVKTRNSDFYPEKQRFIYTAEEDLNDC